MLATRQVRLVRGTCAPIRPSRDTQHGGGDCYMSSTTNRDRDAPRDAPPRDAPARQCDSGHGARNPNRTTWLPHRCIVLARASHRPLATSPQASSIHPSKHLVSLTTAGRQAAEKCHRTSVTVRSGLHHRGSCRLQLSLAFLLFPPAHSCPIASCHQHKYSIRYTPFTPNQKHTTNATHTHLLFR